MSDMIPAKFVNIGAVIDYASMRVLRVVVIDSRIDPSGQGLGPREWRDCNYTTGACCSDWMKGHHSMTPEWAFSELMVAQGFADSRVAEQAIAEFAKIAECGWARAMVPTEPEKSMRPSWWAASASAANDKRFHPTTAGSGAMNRPGFETPRDPEGVR